MLGEVLLLLLLSEATGIHLRWSGDLNLNAPVRHKFERLSYTRKFPSYTELMRKYGSNSEDLTRLPKGGLSYPRLNANVRAILIAVFIWFTFPFF